MPMLSACTLLPALIAPPVSSLPSSGGQRVRDDDDEAGVESDAPYASYDDL